MRSIRKSLFGALVRLAMVPLSLPCLFATCCCWGVALGSGEGYCESPREGLAFNLGGSENSSAGGAHAVDSGAGVLGINRAPNRCGCRPVNSDAKRPLVIRRSTESRSKLIRGIRSALQAASTLSSSGAVDSRSSALARAASIPTAAENCVLLCRLLL